MTIDREALEEAVFEAMDRVEQEAQAQNRGYAVLRDLVEPATDAVLARLAWTRAGVDREALQSVIAPLVAPYVSGPLDPLDVEIADAVLAYLPALAAARAGDWYRQQCVDVMDRAVGGGVTEWGVLYEADRDTVIHEPQESEADARALVESSPTDTALVTREVTPWREVQR